MNERETRASTRVQKPQKKANGRKKTNKQKRVQGFTETEKKHTDEGSPWRNFDIVAKLEILNKRSTLRQRLNRIRLEHLPNPISNRSCTNGNEEPRIISTYHIRDRLSREKNPRNDLRQQIRRQLKNENKPRIKWGKRGTNHKST